MSKYNGQIGNLPFSISQNFLTSARTIKKLLALTSIGKDDLVLEIGSGKGHITKELAKVCRYVIAYEIDPKLYEHTRVSLDGFENLTVRRQDFLKANLPKNEPFKVFSNIPFSITSDIMRKLISARNPPQETWLIMEKGAAKRFIGKPYDTLASILIKPFFDTRIVFYFSPQDFHPMPSVDTVLLHLKRKTVPDILPSSQMAFSRFVEHGLRYGIERQLTKKQISTALKLAKLPQIPTSGIISYVQWLCLFRCHCKFYAGK